MKEEDPESWDEAVMIDKSIRDGFSKTTQKLYVHRSLQPLDVVDLSDPAKDQITFSFMDECDGMCGV